MVLAGVGGRTVAEAKRSLSYAEFTSWLAYRSKFGPLCPGRYVGDSLAVIAAKFAQARGMKLQNGQSVGVSDFLLYDSPRGDDKEGTPEEIFDLLTAVSVGKNK